MENNQADQRQHDNRKLGACRIVIYLLVIISFVLSIGSIYIYYMHVNAVDCWKCLHNSYMIIGVVTSTLTLPLVFITLPLVFLKSARGIRIFLPFLFVSSLGELLMSLVFTQGYPVNMDVMRMWKNEKSLEFFEVNYKCCGVMGPDDYFVATKSLPKSCFKDLSNREEDLHTIGCFNQFFDPPKVLYSKFISSIVKSPTSYAAIHKSNGSSKNT
ncbi:uncharacterized protein LOC108086990 isoform X2 [Drosophila ficusphila]|uniref:uncharacterized protein LOC108086990 isoform X2 n=1 Tax=Drosophila ficusphila TaxID=30025 RepID=UPI0007E8752D|nr:uncharacterized protein LOC108086990 isoform X2 [Drosophila ficusphila]